MEKEIEKLRGEMERNSEKHISGADYSRDTQEREDQFRIISETSPLAIMIYQNDKWVYTNRAASEISGYTSAELKRMNFWDIVHKDYWEKVKQSGRNRQANRKALSSYEIKIISKEGKEKWVLLNGASTVFNGKSAGIIAVQDVTKRKNAEEKLRESEERFKFLTKATFEGIVVHEKGVVLDTNDSFLTMTGYSKKEALGEKLLDYIPLMKDKAKIMINMVKHRAEPYHITVRRKDGSTFIAELVAKNVKNNGKKVRIVAVRDVTQQYEASKQLQRAHEKLGIMNSILRHDLANELSVIESALALYKTTGKEEMLLELEKRVNKCLTTIRKQHLMAVNLNNENEEDQRFDLARVLKQIAEDHPEIKINVTGNETVKAGDAIFSVFDNLVNNAVSHGKADQISVEIKSKGKDCLVRFSDNGKGISDKIKDRIFEEGFFAGKTGNTGIGLSIVKKAITEWKGEISVSNNKPKGVVFQIVFKKS